MLCVVSLCSQCVGISLPLMFSSCWAALACGSGTHPSVLVTGYGTSLWIEHNPFEVRVALSMCNVFACWSQGKISEQTAALSFFHSIWLKSAKAISLFPCFCFLLVSLWPRHTACWLPGGSAAMQQAHLHQRQGMGEHVRLLAQPWLTDISEKQNMEAGHLSLQIICWNNMSWGTVRSSNRGPEGKRHMEEVIYLHVI